jgi:outer membrane protein assembly factor BamB
MIGLRLGVCVAVVLGAGAVASAQWPQFRGPTGQGYARDAEPPLEWGERRNVVWKVPVGGGWSSPVVSGGRVWLTAAVAEAGARGAVSLRAVAFDAETGRTLADVEVFRVESPEAINLKNSRASPTPVVDGGRVYVHFGADGTAALDQDGAILWRTRLPYESQHGNGGSPVLHGGLLIVNCDGWGQEAYVAALDTATGDVRWKTSRPRPWSHAYSTPLVIEVDGEAQVVSTGAFRAVAYEPRTGREIWRVRYADGFSNVPRPVYAHGLVYLATGFNEPTLIAVRPDGHGDVTGTHLAWTQRRGAPYTPSPIVVGDHLYYVSDTGVLTQADARSGTVRWQHRLGGNYSASPVLAGGRLYFLSEEGVTSVLAPGEEFVLLATNRLDGPTLASMAVDGGTVYIRSTTHLYRIEARP